MANPLSPQLQSFRCPTTGEDIEIQVQKGPDESFVLWSDIQSVFEHAKYIRHGKTLVPFMKDTDNNWYVESRNMHGTTNVHSSSSNLTALIYPLHLHLIAIYAISIEPQRISYHPGIVLEVVNECDAQTTSIPETSKVTGVTPEDPEPDSHNDDCYNSIASSTTAAIVCEMDTGHRALVNYSERSSDDPQSSPHVTDHAFETCLHTMAPEHCVGTIDIKLSQDQLQQLIQGQQKLLQQQEQNREELLRKMDQSLEQKHQETLELQRKLDHTQEQILRLEHSIEELGRRQDVMLNLQKRTINRLVVILGQVRALLTQTYELHEYPIPRLFIVLPKSTRFRDKLTNPHCEHFRIYFLCECGAHTMPEGSKGQHEVHLAKHEGYDLERPKEFFEKYGTYVMAMMCMIKYGIVAGSMVVPPLANLKILEGLEDAQKNMDYLRKNFAPLVDDTINFLQDKGNGVVGDGLSLDGMGIDKVEALEGADLRQMGSHLKIQDERQVFGNLYRTVTHEGHVKWVCLDHYRATYRESTVKELLNAVQLHQGKFIEETRRIEIEIATSVQARHFYEVMAKARGTHELQIKLKWDATLSDLREFYDAVTKANVIHLTIDGTHFKNPPIDLVNRGRRFDPILGLASNARIQSLQLIGFDDFFSRVTKHMQPAPRLRMFSMEWKSSFDDKAIKSLNGFLENCPGLTALELKFQEQYPTMEELMDALPMIKTVEALRVHHGDSQQQQQVPDNVRSRTQPSRFQGLTQSILKR
ncbi:MAG: hypothetical protein J3Q66DRAFT_426097 [Benniella sp.]|nr:MAG: hypothetical protein J3Q66DRAFT_426097 [Benniella sp.]